MKVLIVEDDYSKSRMLREYMCNKFNATVDDVIDEKEAKEKLRCSTSYNLVLLDMSLPDVIHKTDIDAYGGMNVLSYMENEKIIIPVIVITSYWDFKNLFMREVKELYFAKNIFFHQEINYDDVEIVEDFDYLDRMHQYMSYTYNHVYFGSIEFSYHNAKWKIILKEFLKELKNNEYIGLR